MVTVKYTLQAGKHASLQITDAMGRIIKEVLLHSDKSSLQLNLASAPNGVYYYRYLVESQQVQNGKLVLMR